MPSYVYEIKNKLNGKRYIGSRKCEGNPQNDLGIKYFSSSHNKEFMKEQKEYPEHFEYHIIQIFENHKDALLKEIELHDLYNVSVNENFYNLAKQTSTGFTTNGLSIPKTDEWKRKISNAKKGKKVSPEVLEKMKKIPRTEEWKKHLSESRKTHSGPWKGKTFDETYKKKLSEAHKQYRNKPIIEFNIDGSFEKEYSELYEIKGHHSNILKCCMGKQKTCNGKIYKFKELK